MPEHDFEALSELAKTDRAEFARRMTEICMGPEPYWSTDYDPVRYGYNWPRVGLWIIAIIGVVVWVVRHA